ncbi:MAG: hypothetical protein K1X91_04040 [Bacteriodetes bacterium]|nr:hypothetical protein [Bacteroidota bacterium]
MKILSIITLIGIPFIVLACCSSKKNEVQPLAKVSPYTGMSIIAGTAGGFTGGSTGIKVNYSGECYNWSRRFSKEDALFAFKASPDSIEALFQQIGALHIDTLTLHTAANVVNFLEVRKDSTVYQINWNPSDTSIPTAIRNLYSAVQLFPELNTKSK